MKCSNNFIVKYDVDVSHKTESQAVGVSQGRSDETKLRKLTCAVKDEVTLLHYTFQLNLNATPTKFQDSW